MVLQVSTLVVAEHKGCTISDDVLCTINAAARLGGEISLLLTGEGVQKATEHAGTAEGVNKVRYFPVGAFWKLISLLPFVSLTSLGGWSSAGFDS